MVWRAKIAFKRLLKCYSYCFDIAKMLLLQKRIDSRFPGINSALSDIVACYVTSLASPHRVRYVTLQKAALEVMEVTEVISKGHI